MKKIVILISNTGTGTNLQAIIDGVETGKINASIAAVISDTPQALGSRRAKKHKLRVIIVPKKEELLSVLKKLDPDYICLAGWRQIILDEVISAFPSRILNTHPGLIPDTMDGVVKNPDGTKALWNKGKMTDKAMQNFLANYATYAGCTNHFLSHEFDFGPVLGRVFEKIRKGDTVKSLYTRLKVKENQLYVDVLTRLTDGVLSARYPAVHPRSTSLTAATRRDALLAATPLTIMIVDGGGRGSVLVDKYGQSKHVGKILVVPGNDLMEINTKKPVTTYQNLKTTSVAEILEISKKEKVDLVDVAQDNAVEVGLADELNKIDINTFGPTRAVGQIEWDKAWARKFMVKYQIPAPKFHILNSTAAGINYIKKYPNLKWFVKASGLAEGKGAIPASNFDEAAAGVLEMKKFGKAGKVYLLEQWLEGEEFSAFALCDGENFKVVGFAQDHKRVFDKDEGPNTGGMGCVSNPLVVNESIKYQVSSIMGKTVEGLKKENRPYKGVLYLGGIVVEGKVYVIEFNARWGDPEAEVILPSIKNDFIDVADAVISGNLKRLKIEVDKKIRVAVAAAAKGYPVDYREVKGKKVLGIDKAIKAGAKIYGAGIKKVGSDYVVNGGRVLYVVGEGENVIKAREKTYQGMKLISIEGNNLHYRGDIGWRDLARLRGLRRVKKD